MYFSKKTEHQLCWAHPQRKLRDIAESKEIEESKWNDPDQWFEKYLALKA